MLKKYFVNFVLFALVAVLADAVVTPTYGSVWVSLLFSTIVTSLVIFVPALMILLIVIAIGVLASGTEKGGLVLGYGLGVPLIVVLEFYAIRWLGGKFDWYPVLSPLYIWLYILTTTAVNILMDFGEKKKD